MMIFPVLSALVLSCGKKKSDRTLWFRGHEKKTLDFRP